MRKRPVIWTSKLAPLQMYWSASLRLGAAWQVSGLGCTHSLILLDVIPRHGSDLAGDDPGIAGRQLASTSPCNSHDDTLVCRIRQSKLCKIPVNLSCSNDQTGREASGYLPSHDGERLFCST